MSEKSIYQADLVVDVHLDAYINVTRLTERRWRIGVLMQPRSGGSDAWWVNDAEVTLTCTGGPSVTAVSVAAIAGAADEPSLFVPNAAVRELGYEEQTDTSVRATSQAMTHAQFDFSVDPDVRGAHQLGVLHFMQSLQRDHSDGAVQFFTFVPFGTVVSGEVVVAHARHEVWLSDEDVAPGEMADVYYVHEVSTIANDGQACVHDWCGELGANEPHLLN